MFCQILVVEYRDRLFCEIRNFIVKNCQYSITQTTWMQGQDIPIFFNPWGYRNEQSYCHFDFNSHEIRFSCRSIIRRVVWVLVIELLPIIIAFIEFTLSDASNSLHLRKSLFHSITVFEVVKHSTDLHTRLYQKYLKVINELQFLIM